LTAAQALEHKWFKEKYHSKYHEVDPTIGNLLRNFRSEKKFKNEVLNVMVNFLTEEELKKLHSTFSYFDKDDSGYISIEELRDSMQSLGHNMTDAQIEELMKTITVNKTAKFIKYSEFLNAAMHKKCYVNEERLWLAFRHFDVDNSGYITV